MYQNIKSISRPILLVEDEPSDIKMTEIAYRKTKLPYRLDVVIDGEQALEYIKECCDPLSFKPLPSLILLDLNLPKIDGREVLQKLKEKELTRKIPVVVLTTSVANSDVVAAYNSYCNSYLQKPLDPLDFIKLVNTVMGYWCHNVILP